MSSNVYFKRGKGPNLLFLHGWGQSKDGWGQIADLLSKDFSCFFIDLPGFGENKEVLGDKSPLGYAKWVNEYTKTLKLNSFSLLGHSFGGRIAVICAAQSKSIAKLILYSSPIFAEKTKKGTFVSLVRNAGIKNVPLISNLLRSQDYKETTEQNREIFLKAVSFDTSRYLKKVEVPTLVLGGDQDDQVSVETLQRTSSTSRDSQLYIFPKCGHFAHLEKPILFSAKVKEFLVG
ncbi:alpha/beta hydrolase [Candidatus Curtissbacteria bacterium]|nr:alpha/beta hydrolase [Candidatus Curtissbacteria bacterium]